MAGTIVVDRLESDSSYTSTINVASKVNFSAGMQIGGQDASFSGMRNRIINGNMTISQRWGTSANTPASGVTYTVDRWHLNLSQASKVSFQQDAGAVSPPVGFKDYIGMTSLSAYSVISSDYATLRQSIEGYNVADLEWGTANAKTITLSFWVRSSLTGTFGGTINNANYSRSYPYTYTINSANTWEYKTVVIPGDTTGTWQSTNEAGIQIGFGFGTGSAQLQPATGSWYNGTALGATGQTNLLGTNGATFYVTGVQVESGSVATAFEYRQFGQELALCQRYFTAFVADGGIDNYAPLAIGRWYEGTSAQFFFTMPTQMRYPPTLDATSTTAVGTFAVNTGGTFNAVVITGMALNERSYSTATVSIGYSTGGQTAGQATTLYCDNTDFARISFTAEL